MKRIIDKNIVAFEKERWLDGPTCPYCKSKEISGHYGQDRAQPRYQYRACTNTFTSYIGTFLEGTHIELSKWILLIQTLKKQPNIKQVTLSRLLHVKRQTIARMLNQLNIHASDYEQQRLIMVVGNIKCFG